MSAAKMESKQASKEANDAANDPARALAYVLRGNKGPEARSARLEDSARRLLPRERSVPRALKARPEIIDEYAPKLTAWPDANQRPFAEYTAPNKSPLMAAVSC